MQNSCLMSTFFSLIIFSPLFFIFFREIMTVNNQDLIEGKNSYRSDTNDTKLYAVNRRKFQRPRAAFCYIYINFTGPCCPLVNAPIKLWI